MILIVGGEPETSSVELITDDDFKRIDLPKLPKEIVGPSLIKHNNVILSCGGEKSGANKECFQLTSDGWCHHSYLNAERLLSTFVSTSTGSYLFGSFFENGRNTYEFLEKDSSVWQPYNMPFDFKGGCAVAISDTEIWLIGGNSGRTIFSFNTNNREFTNKNIKLSHVREGPACAIIPGTKQILVTGKLFSKVKISLVISTTFEFSCQKVDNKFLENGVFFSIPNLK